VKLLVQERDSRTYARYLYTTDPLLSEKVEEACLAGDRGTPRDVKALGLVLLEEGEASGVPHDLHHHDQRRQLVGELNLRSVEAFLMFSSAVNCCFLNSYRSFVPFLIGENYALASLDHFPAAYHSYLSSHHRLS